MQKFDETIALIGGRDNIEHISHCNTRVRLVIIDTSKVKKAKLENIFGHYVKVYKNQIHFIVGPEKVGEISEFFVGNNIKIKDEKVAICTDIIIYKNENYEQYSTTELSDDVFRMNLLGKTYAFISKNGNVYSPVDGKVSRIFPTKHSYNITSEDGIEFVIHIGEDSYKYESEQFESYVQVGQKIKAGEIVAKTTIDPSLVIIIVRNTKNSEVLKINDDNIIEIILNQEKEENGKKL